MFACHNEHYLLIMKKKLKISYQSLNNFTLSCKAWAWRAEYLFFLPRTSNVFALVCEKVCTAFLTFWALFPVLFKCSGVNRNPVRVSSGPNLPIPPFSRAHPFSCRMLVKSLGPSLYLTSAQNPEGTKKPLWKAQWFLARLRTWGASEIEMENFFDVSIYLNFHDVKT